MTLLVGAVAYLAAVTIVIAAVFAGLVSVVNHRPEEPPVLAKSTDGRAAGSERQREEEEQVDPNRVPVWIVPTAKYDYTPVPADQAPKRMTVIGGDARGAMAEQPPRIRTQPDAHEAGHTVAAPRTIQSRRDNDPFFRD
jgi:hypothetical protein